MSTLEKTINLLHALPENRVGVLPDTGKTLEEYREEMIRERFETAD